MQEKSEKLTKNGIKSKNMNNVPSSLSWTQAADCQPPTPSEMGLIPANPKQHAQKFFHEGKLFISVNGHTYDSIGRLID